MSTAKWQNIAGSKNFFSLGKASSLLCICCSAQTAHKIVETSYARQQALSAFCPNIIYCGASGENIFQGSILP